MVSIRKMTAADDDGREVGAEVLQALRLAEHLDRAEDADRARRPSAGDKKSFMSGGTTLRPACGSTTWRIVRACDNPSERAAARWLSWMLSMPARNTSATYAEYARISATEPQM